MNQIMKTEEVIQVTDREEDILRRIISKTDRQIAGGIHLNDGTIGGKEGVLLQPKETLGVLMMNMTVGKALKHVSMTKLKILS